MEIEKILRRIDLDSTKSYPVSLNTLVLLQKHYLLNVPYENLDFNLGKEFSVELVKVFKKIVNNNRGGICYESHTLFMYLLKSLGFRAHFIFAKVEDLTYIGKDYPHLVIIVTIEGIDYLVDVANGQNVREPLNINDENFISKAEENKYKIKSHEGKYTLLVNYKEDDWFPRYYFTNKEILVSDYKNVFNNDEDKNLSKLPLLVTLAKEEGRVTLLNDKITIKESNKKDSWSISNKNRSKVLSKYFNIHI